MPLFSNLSSYPPPPPSILPLVQGNSEHPVVDAVDLAVFLRDQYAPSWPALSERGTEWTRLIGKTRSSLGGQVRNQLWRYLPQAEHFKSFVTCTQVKFYNQQQPSRGYENKIYKKNIQYSKAHIISFIQIIFVYEQHRQFCLSCSSLCIMDCLLFDWLVLRNMLTVPLQNTQTSDALKVEMKNKITMVFPPSRGWHTFLVSSIVVSLLLYIAIERRKHLWAKITDQFQLVNCHFRKSA